MSSSNEVRIAAGDEFKIVFTGPMGAGKTTAIAAISDDEVVRTEVHNSDTTTHAKELTTVGCDFGRILLADGHVIRLFGTPGQERFRFMWKVLGQGAAGVVILLDARSEDALEKLACFVDAFGPLARNGAMVVGVGWTEKHAARSSDVFADWLAKRNISVPVFSVDVRNKRDVEMLVQAIVCSLDAGVDQHAVSLP